MYLHVTLCTPDRRWSEGDAAHSSRLSLKWQHPRISRQLSGQSELLHHHSHYCITGIVS